VKSRAEYSGIIERLRSRQFDGPCPTCGRPFKEHEVALTLDALEDRVEQINGETNQLEQSEQRHRTEAESFEQERLAAEKRLLEMHVLDGRISQGRPMVDSARVELDKAVAESAKALNDCQLELPPTNDEVNAAKDRADALQRIGAALGVVRQLRSNLTQLSEEITAAEQAIATLGSVAYDKEAHDAAEAALSESRAAEATIRQIDREIARRPQLEADRDQTTSEMKRLGDEQRSVEHERKTLGFDPNLMLSAVATEQAALDSERAAFQDRNDAQNAQRAAETARKNLLGDQERITGLARRAEERRREADELQRMYREFTSFDQYVVNLITPQMADHASQLVADVTEGKYDRIEFDDDYGIRVFDGDEDFPMDEFSGGERDVIALCARLALSRIVGSRANRPLSFLVLDEVFGSLDRDRRANLMSTLTQLSGTAEAFSQLFIISHVDDVRQAPDINEVWRISESSDGVSHLENLTATGGIEEF
jgi:exonuclease SbcC